MVDKEKETKSWLEKDGVTGAVSDLFDEKTLKDNDLLKMAAKVGDFAVDLLGKGFLGEVFDIKTEGDSQVKDIGKLPVKLLKEAGCGDVESASGAEANLPSLFRPGLKGKPPEKKDDPKKAAASEERASVGTDPGSSGPSGSGGRAVMGHK